LLCFLIPYGAKNDGGGLGGDRRAVAVPEEIPRVALGTAIFLRIAQLQRDHGAGPPPALTPFPGHMPLVTALSSPNMVSLSFLPLSYWRARCPSADPCGRRFFCIECLLSQFL